MKILITGCAGLLALVTASENSKKIKEPSLLE